MNVVLDPPGSAATANGHSTGGRVKGLRSNPAPLTNRMTASEAFSEVVAPLAAQMIERGSDVVGGPVLEATEAVHQMRVAVRRFRSALAVFEPAVGCDALDDTVLQIRPLVDRLGPARDWDVFATETVMMLDAAFPDDDGVARLLAQGRRRQGLHRDELAAFIAGAQFTTFARLLRALIEEEPWRQAAFVARQAARDRPVAEFAAEVLRHRSHAITKARRRIDRLPAPKLHRIRLKAKRLRYAAEFFAPLFPGHAMEHGLRRLTKLQEQLGRLNDGAVAAGLMAELAVDAPGAADAEARGVVRGYLAARAGDARPQIAKTWRKFRHLKAFSKL